MRWNAGCGRRLKLNSKQLPLRRAVETDLVKHERLPPDTLTISIFHLDQAQEASHHPPRRPPLHRLSRWQLQILMLSWSSAPVQYLAAHSSVLNRHHPLQQLNQALQVRDLPAGMRVKIYGAYDDKITTLLRRLKGKNQNCVLCNPPHPPVQTCILTQCNPI